MNEAIRSGQGAAPQAVVTAELSVVVPTFNERDNVVPLFRKLETALAGRAWEVIYVDDDSPDGTWDVVRTLAQQDSRCVASGGSGGAGYPAPASREFWRPVRPAPR